MRPSSSQLPHPLAIALIEHLVGRDHASVVDFGTGQGRNAKALREAGLHVIAVDDAAAADASLAWEKDLARSREIAAVLSTHALLHGTPEVNVRRLGAFARYLMPRGLFFATFASIRDARYGAGTRVTEDTFAPTSGDERGVAHVYYGEAGLRALLDSHFAIESLEEHDVDTVAGTWAHPATPLRNAVHWFASTRVRS